MKVLSIACVAGAVLVAGCAAPVPDDPNFVPIRQLLAETADLPVECAEYDAASNTCNSLARMKIEGDSVVNWGRFMLSEKPRLTADIAVRFRVENGQACGNFGKMQMDFVEVDDDAVEAQVIDPLRASFAGMGDFCVAYYRLGDGRYISEARDLTGKVLPDGRQEVRFFAREKRLRPLRP